MEKLTKNQGKINIKKVDANTETQILLQEEQKDMKSLEGNDIDFDLGHIYGSW